MAKRIFELPRQDQLTKEQRKILRLPAKGQYLIVGAPGTGKSVVALMRFKALRDDDKVHFLTFNHVLNHANKYLVNEDDALSNNMHTAMSWIYDLQWQISGGTQDTFDEDKMPEIEPHVPDYKALIQRFSDSARRLNDYSLIIDEGQDLPPGWYEAVEHLHLENFFVVADQNQQITEQKSSRLEIETCLGIESDEVIELKENWRNTTPIAAFCSYFYTDRASPKPNIPNRPSADIPILYEYDMLDKVKEQILKEYDFDPSKLIGVFVATDVKREDWVKRLRRDDKKRSNPPPVVSTYLSEKKGDVNIDFGQGGIVVLNDKSVKGIEFDTVFIQTDGFVNRTGSEESLKKRLYVMSSRAREKLYLFKSHIQNSPLEEILPPEGEVFKYKADEQFDELEIDVLKRIKL